MRVIAPAALLFLILFGPLSAQRSPQRWSRCRSCQAAGARVSMDGGGRALDSIFIERL